MPIPIRGDIIEIQKGDTVTGWIRDEERGQAHVIGRAAIHWDRFTVNDGTARFCGRYIVTYVDDWRLVDGHWVLFVAAIREDKPVDEILLWLWDTAERRFPDRLEHVDSIPAPRHLIRSKHKSNDWGPKRP